MSRELTHINARTDDEGREVTYCGLVDLPVVMAATDPVCPACSNSITLAWNNLASLVNNWNEFMDEVAEDGMLVRPYRDAEGRTAIDIVDPEATS